MAKKLVDWDGLWLLRDKEYEQKIKMGLDNVDDVLISEVKVREDKVRFRGVKLLKIYDKLGWLGERLTLWHLSLGQYKESDFVNTYKVDQNGINESTYDTKIGHSIMCKFWENLWHRLGLHLIMHYNKLMSIFKQIGMWFKLNGTVLFGNHDWMQFVGLETIGTYMEEGTEELISDGKVWLAGNIDDKRTEEYYEKMYDLMPSILRGKPVKQSNRVTIMDFVSCPDNYGTSGASEDRGEIEIGGKNVAKNKWNSFLSLDPSELASIIHDSIKKELHANIFGKNEHAKVRGVMRADNILHLKFSYLNSIIEQVIDWDTITPLFMNTAERIEWWNDTVKKMSQNITVGVPFDQGKFDHNVTMKEIVMILKYFYKLLISYDLREEAEILLTCIEYITTRHYWIHAGSETWIWEHGIPSGFRWTALLDTAVNACQFITIYQLMSKNSHSMIEAKFMGDDIASIFEDKEIVVAMVDEYVKQGLDPSVGKWSIQWVNHGVGKYVEFLRTVADGSGVYTYLARCISSIFENKPNNVEQPKDARRLSMLVNNWCLLYSRGHIDNKIWWRYMVQDIMHGMGWTKEFTVSYLITSKVWGGAGLGDLDQYDFNLVDNATLQDVKDVRPSFRYNDNVVKHLTNILGDNLKQYIDSRILDDYVGAIFGGDLSGEIDIHYGDYYGSKLRFILIRSERKIKGSSHSLYMVNTYKSFLNMCDEYVKLKSKVKYRKTFERTPKYKRNKNIPSVVLRDIYDVMKEKGTGVGSREILSNFVDAIKDRWTTRTLATWDRLYRRATLWFMENWLFGKLDNGYKAKSREADLYEGMLHELLMNLIFDRVVLAGLSCLSKAYWVLTCDNATYAHDMVRQVRTAGLLMTN